MCIRDRYRHVAKVAGFPVVASGGISTLDDIRALAAVGEDAIEGAITGRALYEGNFTPVSYTHLLAVELIGNETLAGSKFDGLHIGIPYRSRLCSKNERPGGGANWPAARTLGRPCVLALLCRARDGLKMLVLHGRHQAICQIAHTRIQASGTRVDKEAGRAVHNAAGDDQVVVAQGGTRGGNVHDAIGHADNGAQIDVCLLYTSRCV